MKKSRFTDSQIVAILREVELGATIGETCRKHGISEAARMSGYDDEWQLPDTQPVSRSRP